MNVQSVLDFFSRRRTAYRVVFSRTSPAAQSVLSDIEEFCCANRTTMNSNDPYELARNEGRRQVWLRITRALNLTPEEQFALAQQKDKPK